ncbi:MAG: GNAT family N-acetyltransferase, partial [Candidatus Delongbacteria bacterium]|nr:GNAT family N-acetyltransferase [Candidatus Delongbacteria bacterium]
KVAEMWNRSSGHEGWNGEVFNNTEESVKKNEAKSTDINLFLAETDDKIVGYCTLKEYSEDIGALYIGLLNVEPDYMGKKIGKMLVLRSVERTIELGYPRLDLFTWGGNTKAMPLYKKCGFFWEEMDRATHLMDFIPSVLQEDIFKEYFKEVDWYNDSKRVIEIVPDGRKENKFEYYTYTWEKDGNKLEIDYERRGRGLRRIDCNDYSIEAVVENLELVFGSKYKVKYIVKNKSGKDLNISFKGMNDRNVDFSMDESSTVENEKTFEGEFFVGKIDSPQNIWKTHPTVKSEISINGVKTIFKVGIEPKIPLSMTARYEDKLDPKGIVSNFQLDIENNFDKPAKFSFRLPSDDVVEILNGEIDIDLKSREKISFKIEYKVKKAGVYIPELEIKAKPEGDEEFAFMKKALVVFNVENEMYVGKTERNYIIGNNKFHFYLGFNKDLHNRLSEGNTTDVTTRGSGFFFMTPKLGKPYTEEFVKRAPEKVDVFKKDNYVQMSAHYRTKEDENLEFITHYQLYPNGKLVRWNEFIKSEDLDKGLFFSSRFWMNSENAYIPCNDKVIKTNKRLRNEHSYWQDAKLTENWLYTYGKKFRSAVIWPKDSNFTIGEWNVGFEYEIPKEKGTYTTEKEVFYSEAPRDWKDLRMTATGIDSKDEEPVDSFEITINEGNPVMKKENILTVKDLSSKVIKGYQSLSAENGRISFNKNEIELKHKLNFVNTKFTYEESSAIDIINIHSNFGVFEYFDKRLVVNPTQDEIKTSKDDGIVAIDNGILSFRSDEKFAPSVFSLKYNGKEWLDTLYPEVGPKSWWSSWFGGISVLPISVANKKLLEQKRNSEVVKVKDNLDNEWTGIKITMEITDHEKLKGYLIDSYFMVLPGVPVMWSFAKVHNNTGNYLDTYVETMMWGKASDDIKKHYFIQPSTGYKFNAGKEMQDVKREKLLIFSEENSDEFINIYSADNMKTGCHFDTAVCLVGAPNDLKCKDKESKLVGSKFIVFSDDKLKAEWLVGLKKIKPII